MARIRTVKPELFTHGPLHDAERDTGLPLRLAFIGLFTVADREGRFKWRPREMKLAVLPYDEGVDFAHVLDALAVYGFVTCYDFEGERFGYIPTFHKHQTVNTREAQSRLPDPVQGTVITCQLQCNYSATRVHARAIVNRVEATPDKGSSDLHGNSTAMHMHAQGEGNWEGNWEGNKTSSKEETAAASPMPARIDDEKGAVNAGENSRAVEIAVRLRRAGIRGANASNPHILEWSENPKITDDMLDAAADLAKARTTNPGPNYLAPIIAQLLNPPPPKRKPDDWHRTDPGIERKARELGITPRMGETFPALKARLFDEIARRERGNGAAA